MRTAFEVPTRETIAPPGRWTVDPRHSVGEFAIKHLAIATIKGRFRDFEGTLEVQEVTGEVRGHGIVRVESIDTAEPKRDGHLLSPDFFDVDQFPEIKLVVRGIEPIEETRYRVLAEITIRGIRRSLMLDANVNGTARDPWENEHLSLDLAGSLNRKDFGLRWNQIVDSGPVAGAEVRLAASLSLIRRSV
jgi:polyisoprenoid-binding protein YceI